MEKHSGRVTHLNVFKCALACQKCVEHGCINQQPLQPWLEDQRSVFFMFLKNQTYLNLRSILKSFAGVVILVFKATYPISIYGDFLVTEEEFSSR